MNGDSYAWRSRRHNGSAHLNLIPSHSPKPRGRHTAPPGCNLSEVLPGAIPPEKGTVQRGPNVKADYNIACKCKQMGVGGSALKLRCGPRRDPLTPNPSPYRDRQPAESQTPKPGVWCASPDRVQGHFPSSGQGRTPFGAERNSFVSIGGPGRISMTISRC